MKTMSVEGTHNAFPDFIFTKHKWPEFFSLFMLFFRDVIQIGS